MPTTKAVLSDPLTTPSYTPADNEMRLVKGLNAAVESGSLRREIAGMIECLQFRKVSGAAAIEVTEAEEQLIKHRLSALKVTPRFTLSRKKKEVP